MVEGVVVAIVNTFLEIEYTTIPWVFNLLPVFYIFEVLRLCMITSFFIGF